jgi:hypothetical protein
VFINWSVCGVKTLSAEQLFVIDGPLNPTVIYSYATTTADEQGSVP